MEDINKQSEQNRINPEENINPKTMLSVLFNEYQN